MSRIDELIMEFCPNGVTYFPLWKVTVWDKRFNSVDRNKQAKTVQYAHVSASSLKELETIGDVKLLSTGKYEGWTSDELAGHNLSLGEVITVPSGGSAIMKYWNGKFVDSGNLLGVSADSSKYNLKFVYYFLLSKNAFVESCFRGSGVKHPDMRQILELKVPTLHIEIQNEIVNILDKFTQLETELSTELLARRKQYEYYRENLLGFGDPALPKSKLGEVAAYSKSRISSNELNHENYIGVDNLLQNRQGKENSSYVPTTGNLTRYENEDVLIGNIRPYLKKIWYADRVGGTNGDVLVIQIKDDSKARLKSRYLYHLLASNLFFSFNMQNSKGSKMPRGDKALIMKFEITVPSIERQEYVISILDKFNNLTTDASTGLPAEIDARRQQYEHYRTKLLTFQELTS